MIILSSVSHGMEETSLPWPTGHQSCNKLRMNQFCSRMTVVLKMVAYFRCEIPDSYRDNFRNLSRKFEISMKFYLDGKKFSEKYISR